MENTKVMYHIGLEKKDLKGARYALLTGDPGRVEKIANMLDNPEFLNINREYTSYLGEINGVKVLVMSHGMGGPSTAICVEELNQIGIKYMIRIGTCGGMQLDVNPGDLIVAQAAIRQEGTSKEYVPIEFPAVADIDLVNALRLSAYEMGYMAHTGVVQCKDSFYGQHDPKRMPVGYELVNKWEAWKRAGCLASEMETASLFTVASCLKMKAAAVLLVVWNQEQESIGIHLSNTFDTESAIKVAIDAIKNLL